MTIQNISVNANYCFGVDPLRLENLGKVNFIFAPNGSGKTTISKALAAQPIDLNERASWTVAPTELPIRVFNEQFRAGVLQERVDGIFTLGEKAGAAADEVESLEIAKRSRSSDRSAWKEKIGKSGDVAARSGLLGDIDREWDIARERLFDAHKKVDEEVRKVVFRGFRSDRTKFFKEALRRYEVKAPISENVTWDSLKERTASLSGDPELRSELPEMPEVSLLLFNEQEILGRTLEGGGAGRLAALIRKIGNNDWVSVGRQHLENSDGVCPFCQQVLPEDFIGQLTELFSSGFDELLVQARGIRQNILNRVSNIRASLTSIKDIIKNDSSIDRTRIDSAISSVESALEITVQRVEEKCSHPGVAVQADDCAKEFSELSSLISEENGRIKEHNRIIANAKSEEARIVSEGWALFLNTSDVSSALRQFLGIKQRKEEEIENLRQQVAESIELDSVDDDRIAELRSSVSNTSDVAVRINKLLESMGFHRFKVATDDSVSGGYRIVRSDGTLAHDSLSEGERSFLTFAYFWESIFGSDVSGGHPEDAIAVFDDPISSLDSETLFMVSAYIREAAAMVTKGGSSLRQLIVLTHNTQFHIESAYESSKSPVTDRHYYRLVKSAGGLTRGVDDGNECKVRGSYPMLWDSVIEAARSDGTSQLIRVGVFNIVRRIIEGYFKTIGRVQEYRRPANVTPAEERVMRMFHIWASAGSHTITDDADQTIDEGGVQGFLKIFRRYFDLQGHDAHFDMMLRASDGSDLSGPGEVFEPTVRNSVVV